MGKYCGRKDASKGTKQRCRPTVVLVKLIKGGKDDGFTTKIR